jgi:NADPH-dependent F420 reductase
VISFLGGTGPQGRGLALRLALAGHTVAIGSRDVAKAEAAVGKLAAKTDQALDVRAATNEEVADQAEVVVVTVPYAAQRATLTPLAAALAGKVVVSCVNAVAFDDAGPHPLPVPDGSAAQEVARLLPGARVVGAFQNVSAPLLLRVADPVAGDVLLVGDDEAARERVAALVADIADLRPVHVGPLRLAGPIEEMTAVLLAVNKRYGAHAGLALTGLDRA